MTIILGGDSLIHKKTKTKTPKSIEDRRAPPRGCDNPFKNYIILTLIHWKEKKTSLYLHFFFRKSKITFFTHNITAPLRWHVCTILY